jgi:hypothetical protein
MHDKQPPKLTRADLMPRIRCYDDLRQHWRALMGPLGFTKRSLWLLFVDADHRATNVLTRVEELPLDPDTETLRNIMYVSGRVLESAAPGGSLALQISRPGRGQFLDTDRAWARGLTAAAAEAMVPLLPIHLASCDDIRMFAPDDLIPTSY